MKIIHLLKARSSKIRYPRTTAPRTSTIRPIWPWVALAVALSSTGCLTQDPPGGPAAPAEKNPSCATGRWVGISSHHLCPAIPGGAADGWRSRALFEGAAGDPRSILSPFCLYENDDPTRGSELDRLVTNGALERVDPDCAEVFVAAPLYEALAPALEEQFLAQTGAIPLPESQGGPVRLAVLDTSPTSEGEVFFGEYKHGATLAHLARKLLCRKADSSCIAQVATRLALPMLSLDEIGEEGGYFGTQAQLAEAIQDEVSQWQPSADDTRLILNLALAWRPHSDFQTGGMQAGVQAVYEALRNATCRGVLVVAATGNLGSGPEALAGPLLPAAWQAHRAPSELPGLGACVDAAPVDQPDPLLYAASAVDGRGIPLANSRPEAEPALVAYGSHGVTALKNSEWTGTYTGSSVSTAVISSAAAAVWHYRPDFTRNQVMRLLHQSGDPLGREAKAVPDQENAGEVRKASLCKALETALNAAGLCANAGWVSWTPGSPTLSVTPDGFWKTVDASSLTAQAEPPAPCPNGSYRRTQGYDPQNWCPYREVPGIDDHPWVGPQPEDIPCPSCPLIPDDPDSSGLMATCPGVEKPYTLFIEIDPEYQGGTLTGAKLRIGDRHYLINTSLDPNDGNLLQVKCIEGASIDAQTTADLTFAAEHHGSVMNVIPISAPGQ